ncbi:DNA-binding protein [Nodosilinea sp. AN01ver1]|uniref:DNA-binding protein n=1 Tax=Nodosilinea sp. AN01ver1 TaxID=3423362 RepID=UPI003D321F08
MTKLNSNWVTTGAACSALGISDKQLWRLRDELFTQGTHYRNIARPQAARPTYRWHLARIEKLLNVPQENRGA